MKVYKKVGRRYQEIGREFTGFPSDGIWFVKDGTMSSLLKLHEIGDTSVDVLPYLELVERFFKDRYNPSKGYSYNSLARELALFFEENARKEKEK